ncbi:MAG TPA: FeoB-associated Cys-rich membrane protein [Abditibacteriaceae bacterium]|jgi:hypothetical protein
MTQELVVYLIVALAAGYLVRNLWLSAQNKKGCGCDSGGCSKLKSSKLQSSKLQSKASTQPVRDSLVQVTLNFNNASADSAARRNKT